MHVHALHLPCSSVSGPAPFLPHLSPTLPFAPLIFHLSLILCLFYISIHRMFLLVLTGEWAERVRKQERGSCPLWVAKRLWFKRSNPLHHTYHNLLCSHITLWEPISSSSACLAPPLLFSSSILIRLFLLHLWLSSLSLIPPTSKPFNSCLWVSIYVLSLFLVYLGATLKYTANVIRCFLNWKLIETRLTMLTLTETSCVSKISACLCLYVHMHTCILPNACCRSIF